MRASLWGIAALVLGALLAQALLHDHGYVLISFRGYVAELSVPGLVLAFAAFYIVIRLILGVVRTPRHLGRRYSRYRTRRAAGRMSQALLKMAEGDWAKGERLLTRGLRGSDAPVAHYLLAARAAQKQGFGERRDEWLKRAYEHQPKAVTPILLTRAELQFEGGESERAMATLRRIVRRHPKSPVVLALLARVCAGMGDYEQLAVLLPRLGRRPRIESVILVRIAIPALERHFAYAELTVSDLERYWKSLPKLVRAAPAAVALRAEALQRLGQGERAARELRAALARRWQSVLITAYGKVRASDPERQYRYAEEWLRSRPEDAALLETAARLCMVVERWGQARSYLESCLAMEPDPGRYALYGQLLDQLGDSDRAALAFRSGLVLLEHRHVELPALIAPGRNETVPATADAALNRRA